MERFMPILAELRSHWSAASTASAEQLLASMEDYLATGNDRSLQNLTANPDLLHLHRIAAAIGPLAAFDVFDQRAMDILARLHCDDPMGWWLENALAQEHPDADSHLRLRNGCRAAGRSDQDVVAITFEHAHTYRAPQGPNSAGRYVLALPQDQLLTGLRNMRYIQAPENGLLALLLRHLPPAHGKAALAEAVRNGSRLDICRLLCAVGGPEYADETAAAFDRLGPRDRVWLTSGLDVGITPRFKTEILAAAREMLQDDEHGAEFAVDSLLKLQGTKALGDLVSYVSVPSLAEDAVAHRKHALSEATSHLGPAAGPVLSAGAAHEDFTIRLAAIEHMLKLKDASLAPSLEGALWRGLDAEPRTASKFLEPAAQFSMEIFGLELVKRLTDKSKLLRDGAAEALGRHDPEALSRAAALLTMDHRFARSSGVRILGILKTPESLELLKAHFDKETDEDIRQALLAILKSGGVDVAKLVRSRAPSDLAAIKQAAAKISKLGISWMQEEDLPPLLYRDGAPVELSEVRYLLFRQAHQAECAPDIEAFLLFTLIDPRTAGEFGLKVLTLFTQAGANKADAWALIIASIFGDARVVSGLSSLIRRWADEGNNKLGQWGIEALALNGGDSALAAVEAIAARFRTSTRSKHKRVGETAQRALYAAAQRLNISMDDLGDRIVPWLGFAPGQRRIIDCGSRQLEASIGLDFKLQLKDVATGKRAISIPKTAPAEVQADFKGLGNLARETGKAQSARLEYLMVRRHRWTLPRWKDLFLQHPLLLPFAVRLVWGIYDSKGTLTATFRAIADRTLTTSADEPFDLPEEGACGIVHPIELADAALTAWRTHMADYEIESPFPQMDRSIARPTADLAGKFSFDALDGMRVASLSIRGKGQKRGWNVSSRHSAIGMQKDFGGQIEAFVQVDGLEFYFTPDPTAQVTVRTAAFFAATSKDAGTAEARPAVVSIPLGEVPPLVYSEAISDLQVMSGAAG